MVLAHRGRWSIWSIAVVFGPMVLAIRGSRPISDNSYLWHVTAGRLQTEAGRVLTSDPFSFTAAAQPWRTQSWLADLLYSWAHTQWGLSSGRWIPIVFGSLLFLLMATLARTGRRFGLGIATVLSLSAFVMIPFMNPRPVILSYIAFALVILAAEKPKLWWALPIVTWMWAGIHGSFALVFVIIGVTYLRTSDRRLVSVGVASAVSSLCTAHGTGVGAILGEFLMGRQALDRIQEWQPPDLISVPLWPVIAVVVLLAVRISSQPISGRTGFGILIWFVFGLTANRSIPLMWIALTPIVATSTAWIDDFVPQRSMVRKPVAVVLGVCLIGLPIIAMPGVSLDTTRFPVEAAEALRPLRTFHDDATGGYLIYALGPQTPVYIDDRAELYKEQFVTFSDVLAARQDWQAEFARWGIEQALLPNTSPLARLLRAEGWTSTFEDDDFIVLLGPSAR